jgi:starch synthase
MEKKLQSKNLVFVTPEMKSFKSKVGGLGDVSEELGKALANLGMKVTFVTLLYKFTRQDIRYDGKVTNLVEIDYRGVPLEDTGKEIEVEVAGEKVKAKIKKSKIGRASVVFLENGKYTNLVYGGDFLKQAIFIGRGTLEALKALNIKPAIIHCHDGLTSLVNFVRTDEKYSKDPFFKEVKLVFTVHNAGKDYQQIFSSNRFNELGISKEHWDGMVYNNSINLTYAGAFHSQTCTTVSDDYANTLKRDGEGLTEIFKQKNIFGIINGIDFNYWKIKGSKKNAKLDLLKNVEKRTGTVLDENKFTIILPRRIAFQKGLDVVIDIMRDVVEDRNKGGVGAQFILLGRAHEKDEFGKKWENELAKLSREFKNKFVFINDFDQAFAELMYRGGDLLLYPSKPNMEPCGTGYMLAMANMTPALGTDTGGIVEVIEEFDPNTGKGSGFKVSKEEYSSRAFLNKLKIISDIFYNHPEQWKKLMENCFNRIKEFDMKEIAKKYILKIYTPLMTS